MMAGSTPEFTIGITEELSFLVDIVLDTDTAHTSGIPSVSDFPTDMADTMIPSITEAGSGTMIRFTVHTDMPGDTDILRIIDHLLSPIITTISTISRQV